MKYRLIQTKYGNWMVEKVGLLWDRLLCSWDGDPALYQTKDEARRFTQEAHPGAQEVP